MTKSDLIERLCQAGGMPLIRAESIVNTIFDSIESALKKGERTEIRGFGSFEVRNYGEYAGRNPRSGTTVVVKAKRLPFFKTGKELKDRINVAAQASATTAGAAATAQLKTAARRGPQSAPALSAASSGTSVTSSPSPAMSAAVVAASDEATPRPSSYPQVAVGGR